MIKWLVLVFAVIAACLIPTDAAAKPAKTSALSGRSTNIQVDVKILPEDQAVRNAVINIDSMLPPRPDQVKRLAMTWRGGPGDTTMRELREEAFVYIRSLTFEPNDTLIGAVMSLRLDQPQLAAYEASGLLWRSDTTGEYAVTRSAEDEADEEGARIFATLLAEKVNRARSLIEAEIRRQYRARMAREKLKNAG